jgi:S-DNA-T family DNA segregation ATPase FtsK/SpoIIIE
MAQKPSPPTWDERVISSLMPWRVELAGLGIFMFSVVTLLALPGWTSAGWLRSWTSILRQLIGWGAYPLCLSTAAGGLHLSLRSLERPYQIRATQVIGFELVLLAVLPLSYLLSRATLATAHAGRGGGLVGWALSEPLIDFFGPFLTGLLYLVLIVWGGALVVGWGWDDFLQGLKLFSQRMRLWATDIAPEVAHSQETDSSPEQVVAGPPPAARPELAQDELLVIDESGDSARSRVRRRDKRLPPISLLDEGATATLTPAEIDSKKQIIEQTLLDFGLPAQVVEVRRGPAVTQFGVLPGYIERPGPDGVVKQQKVRVNQIASLQRDLAMALAVSRLRIQAPVPGRGVVGVEVPNDEVTIVRLRSIIESEPFFKINKPLAAALGRDVSGSAVATDLASLPHLLVAGTTGAGKSICINAIISCLVFNNTPEQLNLVMIDPKKVELVRFNGLPHLIGKVEVEADRAVGVLRWLTAEMDRRYEMFTSVGARNLNGYNRRIARRSGVEKLPHIAVFIDELADLMHTYPGDVERTLCRLAQMARATGIHMMLATQRPSTDVITGLIKANFPARLSFAVASTTDSRVILDSVGAEQLLGNGDMLFLAPDSSAPLRVQGVFVTDMEIERLVDHWQTTMPDFEPMPAPWESLIARHALLEDTDTLLEAAISLVQKMDHVSTSLLQRRLRIGFPRAARLMEHLYEMGLVEDPKTGGKTRRTYVSEEDEDPLGQIISEREGEE